MNKKMCQILAVFVLCFSGSVFAQTKIAILDFELKDLTLAPGISAEIERTAARIKTIAPAWNVFERADIYRKCIISGRHRRQESTRFLNIRAFLCF